MPNTMNAGYYGRIFPADEMYVYVDGLVTGAQMYESMQALPYMRKMHAHHFRSDGQRYEVHPLSMACYALSLRPMSRIVEQGAERYLIDDATVAMILLHDVPEEAEIAVESIPFGKEVVHGLKYLTVPERLPGETEFRWRRRYANGWLEDFRVVLCKALDMFYNFSTMKPSFSDDRIRKNVVEADLLRMRVLRDAQNKYPDLQAILWVLQENIKMQLYNLAIDYNVRLRDSGFVNAPDAKDYSYLIDGGVPENAA